MDIEKLNIQANLQFILELPAVYEGPLSKVYKAQDLTLNRTVGIKEVELQNLTKQERSTLQSEIHVWCDYASRTSKMPQIFFTFSDRSKLYIIMQWLEGETLRSLINKGKLSFYQKLSYSIQLCDALVPIHRRRMQHRDLKPENIQIAQNQQLYLMDFNISAAVPHVGTGTSGYLAPECSGISLQNSAAKVDVFSIGVIMYELFTGAIPVFGLDYACEPADPDWALFINPSQKQPELPKELDSIIRKCMALQWQNRYPDAGAIQRELIKLQKGFRAQGGRHGS